jgi:hypothetical protein
MTSREVRSGSEESLGRLKMLVWLAVAGAVLAAVAGLVLLVAEPDAGSVIEGVLAIAAVVGGVSAAVFSITAAIYAQVKGLWGLAPKPIRYALWILIAIAIARTLWNWGTNLLA